MNNIHSIHARSPIAFDQARAEAARRQAEQLATEMKMDWHRMQAHKRQAWREGLAQGMRYGARVSGGLLLVLGLICGAAVMRALA